MCRQQVVVLRVGQRADDRHHRSDAATGRNQDQRLGMARIDLALIHDQFLRSTPHPVDEDEDGIADKEDNCPDEKGLKEFNGCPDRDEDVRPQAGVLLPPLAFQPQNRPQSGSQTQAFDQFEIRHALRILAGGTSLAFSNSAAIFGGWKLRIACFGPSS